MWLIFALLASLFFAVVHVLDSFCVDEILEKTWMGITTSALSSLIVFVLVPFVFPFIDWEYPTFTIISLAFFAGVLIQVSQIFYFRALYNTEAGIVAAYWNLIPALLPLASFIFFNEVLTGTEYLGIAILILASTWMCILDYYFETRVHTFLLMLMAALLQVAAYLLMDIVYDATQYFIAFLLITIGIISTGSAPLLNNHVRKVFKRNWIKIKPALNIFLLIEIVNLLALASAQMAINLGTPSLVAAAETTMPAYTFALSAILLSGFFDKKKYGDAATWHRLPWKLLNVVCMAIGVWLIS